VVDAYSGSIRKMMVLDFAIGEDRPLAPIAGPSAGWEHLAR